MVETQPKTLLHLWVALITPPILLFVLIAAVGTYFGMKTHGDHRAIREGIERHLPYILMINHFILFLILLQIIQADGLNLREIGWKLPHGFTSIWLEPLIGIIAGVLLRLVDRTAISPLVELIQRIIGHYRLAPSIDSNTSPGSRLAWLIVGTVFAGIVEESLYRGYALTCLRQRLGIGWAVVVASVFFGLLHWGEGLGAVMATMVSGALLAGLFLWRQTLVTAAVAHAATNLMVLL